MSRNCKPHDRYKWLAEVIASALRKVNAFAVFAGSRIDLDDVPFLDEPRDDELATSFHLGRLGYVGRSIALGPWIAFNNLEFHVGRWGHTDRITVEKDEAA